MDDMRSMRCDAMDCLRRAVCVGRKKDEEEG